MSSNIKSRLEHPAPPTAACSDSCHCCKVLVDVHQTCYHLTTDVQTNWSLHSSLRPKNVHCLAPKSIVFITGCTLNVTEMYRSCCAVLTALKMKTHGREKTKKSQQSPKKFNFRLLLWPALGKEKKKRQKLTKKKQSLTTSFSFFVCFLKVCHLDLQGKKLEMTHRLRLFQIVMIPW